jgi:uncharacterized protein YukE
VSVRESRETVQAILDARNTLKATLVTAENALQQAITGEADGKITVPQRRYRQACEQYNQALETIDEADQELLADPTQITRDTTNTTPPRDIETVATAGDGRTLADAGIYASDAYQDTANETLDDLTGLHQMLEAAWWTTEVITEFSTREEIK